MPEEAEARLVELLGFVPDEDTIKLFRGGPLTAGAIQGRYFLPFRNRADLGEVEGPTSLKDFINEVNKNLFLLEER